LFFDMTYVLLPVRTDRINVEMQMTC